MDVEKQEQSNTNSFRKWGQKRWVLSAGAVATLIVIAKLSAFQGPASPGIGWLQSSWGSSFSNFRSHQRPGLSSRQGVSAEGALPNDAIGKKALPTRVRNRSSVHNVSPDGADYPPSDTTSPPNPEEFAPPSPGQGWPPSNNLSRQMMDFNKGGPWRNSNATQSRVTASITPTTVPIVIYVHNRPAYLREVLTRLSRVDGIEESLLIVSHDGYFPEVVAVVREFSFMRIKQIFAPFSPHNFKDSFPAHSPDECPEKPSPKTPAPENCTGDPDQYGNFRNPFFVGLKHHWFWLMNHVWDEMEEFQNFDGHILFLEEDHLVVPNAYRTLQVLVAVKNARCPDCIAVSLSTGHRAHALGELGGEYFVADRMSNMGYAFNRTVWRRIKAQARTFCGFDDYGWDWTLECAVMASWAPQFLSLHAAGASVIHVGRCGLHENRGLELDSEACALESGEVTSSLEQMDCPPPSPDWGIQKRTQDLAPCKYTGFGGWGDRRDQRLCLHFAGISERI